MDTATTFNPRLTAVFQDNLGKPVPEHLHSGFIGAKDNGGDGDTWSYKM